MSKFDEKDIINLSHEIGEANGDFVPLTSVNLPQTEGGEDNLLTTEWNTPAGFGAGRELERERAAGSEGGSRSQRKDETEFLEIETDDERFETDISVASAPKVETSRERIERAKQGEGKSKTNPRIIKAAVAAAAIIAVLAIAFIGMSGEKKRSLLSKNKAGDANTAEQQTGENTSQSDTDSTENGGSRSGTLRFGNVGVGTDPNTTIAGATPTDQQPVSTEDAKKAEIYDPYSAPSPTPNAAFPFTTTTSPSYQTTGGGYNYPTGSTNGAGGGGNTDQNRSTPNQTSGIKNDPNNLTDTRLGTETDEERFGVTLRAGQNSARPDNQTSSTEQPDNNNQTGNPFPRGTRLELILDEPIRSGIATAVTARLKKGIANKRGEIVIPKDSMVVVQFSAEVANGRVFNDKEAPIQIVTTDGRSLELTGIVKDAQGFAGLTGKITKTNGRSTLGKIGNVVSRLGGVLPGGQVVTGAQQGIDSMRNPNYVTNAAQIVEVPKGTSFQIIVGF